MSTLPALQQTRIASFLISAHAAEARLLATALAHPSSWVTFGPVHIELSSQLAREVELIALLIRATAWEPDPLLPWLGFRWEMAWLQPTIGVGARAMAIDAAAFGFALYTAIRPAALLPHDAPASDSFCAVLRRMEVEGGRMVQAQLRFLKLPELTAEREAISRVVELRHEQLRRLWTELLSGVGIQSDS